MVGLSVTLAPYLILPLPVSYLSGLIDIMNMDSKGLNVDPEERPPIKSSRATTVRSDDEKTLEELKEE